MCRMGFAFEIVTDLGTSVTSKIMKRLCQVCRITCITSPYHPQTNGLVEKFNETSMRMIQAYVAENPHDWDNKMQPLLSAYRNILQESTRFSPFELLFGYKVREPLDLLCSIPSLALTSITVSQTCSLQDGDSLVNVTTIIALFLLYAFQCQAICYFKWPIWAKGRDTLLF